MAGPLSYALSLTTRGFTGGINTAKGALGGFKSMAGGTASVLLKVAAPLAAVTSGATLAAVAFKSLRAAADMEQTEVGLRSLIGDMGKTKSLLKEVKQLSASTPFAFPELAKSSRSLVAMDVAVEKIPSTLKRIGDVAAGVQAPIAELSLLYGRAKNDGVLYTETLNQLNDRGIPVFTELGKIMGKSNVEVKKLASEGKITFPLLEQSFINLTKEGGKFNGMMAAQSETNTGLLSTLKDGFTDLMLIIGTPINDALKPILKQAIGLVKRIGLGLSGVVDIAKAAIAQGRLGDLVSQALIVGLKTATNYAVGAFLFMGDALYRTIKFQFKTILDLVTGGFNTAIGNIVKGLGNVLSGLGKMILAKLGEPFRAVAALFQAGLEKAVNAMLATISSTKLGKLLGINVQHESFEKLLNEATDRMQVKALNNSGKADIRKGLEQMGEGVGQAFDKQVKRAKQEFKGLKFEPVQIFDTSKDKKAFADMAKTASPEGWKKVVDALNPAAKNLKDSTENTDKALDKAEGLEKALAKVNDKAKKAAKETKEALSPKAGRSQSSQASAALKSQQQTKKRGLLSAAESLQARYNRQADGTTSTFAKFVGRSKLDQGVFKKGKLNMKTSLKGLNRGMAAASKRRIIGNSKKRDAENQQTQETVLSTLKKIDGRLVNLALG